MVWEVLLGGILLVGIYLTLKGLWEARTQKRDREKVGRHPQNAQDEE